MKKILLAIAVVLVFLPYEIAAKEIVIATGEWPPYSSAKMSNGGLCTELVQAAFEAVNIRVKFEFFPWKRAWLNVERGKVDTSFPWRKNDFREKYALFSKELYEEHSIVLYDKQFVTDEDFQNRDALVEQHGLAFVAGDAWISVFKQKNVKITIVPDLVSAIRMLERGRVRFLHINTEVALYGVDKYGQGTGTDFGTFSLFDDAMDNHVVFPKKIAESEELRDRFEKGLGLIKESGKYSEILSRYKFLKVSQQFIE